MTCLLVGVVYGSDRAGDRGPALGAAILRRPRSGPGAAVERVLAATPADDDQHRKASFVGTTALTGIMQLREANRHNRS